jgi:hypothetical protein
MAAQCANVWIVELFRAQISVCELQAVQRPWLGTTKEFLMGTKLEPGAFDCYHEAALDEPMFVLLARDPMAPAIVRRWAAHRELDPGTPPEQVLEALRCADAMEAWYAAHKSS